ncbi:DUF6427 family protein [Salinimicrobium sp. GXAS 041]|uniref:DUF6427 family protein n=1 Tax=Salinimicrobium sp. GXAS 041 TaxID=3400806 RepID=UPI003C7098BB
MLTSFFSKTRPISFIVIATYMVIFYSLAVFDGNFEPTLLEISKEVMVLVVFILSSVLMDFIAKRNEITSRNAYKTILFAAFACMLFAALKNDDVMLANFFVLLAMRRVISLKTQRETKKKIFDATLWICVASLFYFWSILFVGVVFFGIIIHVSHNIRNWLVPVLSFLTILSIGTCVSLLINDTFYTFSEWFQESKFDFSEYRNPAVLFPVSFLLALSLWSLVFYLGIIQRASSMLKSSLLLVLLYFFIAIGVAVLAPTKNSSELIFFLAPLAIIVTNYFQLLKDKWFQEVLLWLVVSLPVLLLVLF